MNLRKLCESNNVKVSNKKYTLSELIQESYKVLYASRRKGYKKLSKLAEAHLINLKGDPTRTEKLSRDLNRLKGLYRLGESAVYTTSAKKSIKESKVVKKKVAKKSWKENRAVLTKGLKNFREASVGKPFYKTLAKFNNKFATSTKMTMAESIDLFKASSSAMTQMTIELEHNPGFRGIFREATNLLLNDLTELRECIAVGKLPKAKLVESFAHFTNVLLNEDTEFDVDTPEKDIDEGEEETAIVNTTDEEFDDDKNPLNEEADAEEVIDHEGEGFETDKNPLDEDNEIEDEIPDEDELDEDVCPNCGQEECICEDDEEEDEEEEVLDEDDIIPDETLEDEILDEEDEIEDDEEEEEEVLEEDEDELDNGLEDEEDEFEAELADANALEEDDEVTDELDDVDDEVIDEEDEEVIDDEEDIEDLDEDDDIEIPDEDEEEDEELNEETDADKVADVDDTAKFDSNKNPIETNECNKASKKKAKRK